MKKVIITGAGGFIGSALSKKLLNDGVTVYGVDVNENCFNSLRHYDNFIPVVADFTKYDKLSELINDEDIDVFYHFAWHGVYGAIFKEYELQLSNTKHACDAIMQAIKIKCKKFVFAGTQNEYDITNCFFADKVEPRYTYIYSATKACAEIICKTIAFNTGEIEYCGGLIAMAYGENNKSMMIPNVVIKTLLSGQSPRLITGNNLYDMIYIDDIVDAFIAIGKKGKNLKSYYIGHRKLKTFKEIISQIGEIINPDIPLLFGEYPEPDDKDYSMIDLDALYNDTGFECKADFKQSILNTAKWIEEYKL